MPAMVWVVLVLVILCMAIPYGKLYLWDRPRRRGQVQPGRVRTKLQAERPEPPEGKREKEEKRPEDELRMNAAKQQNTRKQGHVTWTPCTDNGHRQCVRGTIETGFTGIDKPEGHISWHNGSWRGFLTERNANTQNRNKTTDSITEVSWSDNMQQVAEQVRETLEEAYEKFVQEREEREQAQGEIDNFLARGQGEC